MQHISQWLQQATDHLESAGIATARLDALVLLEDETGKDRSWLLAHPDFELSDESYQLLQAQLLRRANHEPLAYIRGKSEFFGRTFIVTPATLQPRPETETMIELLLSLQLPKNTVVADIGTGSGAIAITAKLTLPLATVYGTDIQSEALEVAKQNSIKLSAHVTFLQGNLLEPLQDIDHIDVLLANLPYVPDSHTINRSAMQEPPVAIFGGEDGLDLYRQMFFHLQSRAQKPKFVLTESLPFQHETLHEIARHATYRLLQTTDFIQVFVLS